MKKHTGTFTAYDDFGQEHVIYIYTDIIDAGSNTNPHATIEGMKELLTESGECVNSKENGVYEVVSSGLLLHSDAPNAP
jgi:hypothetical protein